MEKNRLRPMRIPGSKNIRMSYARQKDVLDMPNLIESAEEFLSVVSDRRPERGF